MYPRPQEVAHPWLSQYDPGVPHAIGKYPERTLLDYLDDGVRERPGASALLFKGSAVSWKQLAEESDAFACALAAIGVTRGDRVAAMLPNCPQFLVAELAAWKLGAIFVPLNPTYAGEELRHPLATTGASVLVVMSSVYEAAKLVQARTAVTRVVPTSIKEYLPPLLRLAFTVAMQRKGGHNPRTRDGDPWLPSLLRRHRGERPSATRPAPDDDAMLLMSGGTSGTPKAVRVHHRGMVQTGLQVHAWLTDVLPPWEGVYCAPLPLFHSYGACGVQTVGLIGHNPIALVPNPRDFDDLVKTIERTKPAVFCGVPTLYNALLNHPRVKSGQVDFKSMRICFSGAAPLMADTVQRFEAVTGARLAEGYALTESLLAATITPLKGTRKLGSVGVPLPDCIIRIVDVDDATKVLEAGETGEILLTGPQIMRGYWESPDQTREILRTHPDGTRWLHTADLGYLDEDGHLFLVDRKKDLIKMGGMQVWPREIEEVLALHPAVDEVGVRGFPDETRGEIAVAFVVRRVGNAVTGNDLRTWCKERLAPYKVPARVEFRPTLPKTLAGKVLRRLLTLGALALMACAPATREAATGQRLPLTRGAQRVLLISLDGFRWDYADRPGAVRLRELAARGVRAERLVPVFPSKTFPNHFSIVTGLRPEQHGIVANAIKDPALGIFRTTDSLAQQDARWWGGEPIWATAERQGRRAASLHWPGSEAPIGGRTQTWWSRYQHDLPRAERVRHVLDWLALPADSAPALITAYFPDLDDAGHADGPDSPRVDSVIAKADSAIGAIVDGIARLGLAEVVNIIIVADHGMSQTSRDRVIVLDDFVDVSTIDVVDWTPVAAIAPRAGDEERVYQALHGKHPRLQVYRKGEVPARWHFNDHPRITPIVAVADDGWIIASRAQLTRWLATDSAGPDMTGIGGAHGYDPALPSMGATFIAAGPGIARGVRVGALGNIHVYPLMAHLLGVRPAPNSGSIDSVRRVLR